PAERSLERFEETGGTRGEDGTGEFLRQSRARDPAKFGEVARLPDSARVTLAGGRHVTGGEDDLADADFGRLEETRSELAVFSLPVRLEPFLRLLPGHGHARFDAPLQPAFPR